MRRLACGLGCCLFGAVVSGMVRPLVAVLELRKFARENPGCADGPTALEAILASMVQDGLIEG